MELEVTGINCGHCESAVRAAVERAAPGVAVQIDRPAGRVSVTVPAGVAADAGALAAAIRDAGFGASPVG